MRPSECCVEVVGNRRIAPGYFSMRLAGPIRLARFQPGQFLMLGQTDGLDPLLPRAMSIRRAQQFSVSSFQFPVERLKTQHSRLKTRLAEVEFLYKVCGRGTARLAAMRPGRSLRVVSPLGNAFEVPRKATDVILVAGGVGVPPIAALAETLADRVNSRRIAVTVLLGGRSRADLLCVSDLRRTGAAVHVATEDGSAGHKGLVTDLFKQFLRTKSPRSPLYERGVGGIYACGPYLMLAALAPIAEQYNLPYQASMEANMACGFGACMGCVVPVRGNQRERTYRLVCKDGPVFDSREILWNEHVTNDEVRGAKSPRTPLYQREDCENLRCVDAEGQGV